MLKFVNQLVRKNKQTNLILSLIFLTQGFSLKPDQWISEFILARDRTIQSSSRSQLQCQERLQWIIGYNNEGIGFLGIPAQSCLALFPKQNFACHTGIFCTLKKHARLISNKCIYLSTNTICGSQSSQL